MPDTPNAGEAGTLHPELRSVLDELEAQTAQVEELLAGLDPHQVDSRPVPDKWSVGEHVEHMAATNRMYLDPLDRVMARAREEGRTGPGPYRHPVLGRLFAWSMKPPPRFRVKTFDELEPAEIHDKDELAREFRETQAAVAARIRAADGLDLGAVRFPSPFVRWLRLSLGTGFRALVAHNERHLWHVERVLQTEGFPGGSPDRPDAG